MGILKNIWLWYLLSYCLQKTARHLVSFSTDAIVPKLTCFVSFFPCKLLLKNSKISTRVRRTDGRTHEEDNARKKDFSVGLLYLCLRRHFRGKIESPSCAAFKPSKTSQKVMKTGWNMFHEKTMKGENRMAG